MESIVNVLLLESAWNQLDQNLFCWVLFLRYSVLKLVSVSWAQISTKPWRKFFIWSVFFKWKSWKSKQFVQNVITMAQFGIKNLYKKNWKIGCVDASTAQITTKRGQSYVIVLSLFFADSIFWKFTKRQLYSHTIY